MASAKSASGIANKSKVSNVIMAVSFQEKQESGPSQENQEISL